MPPSPYSKAIADPEKPYEAGSLTGGSTGGSTASTRSRGNSPKMPFASAGTGHASWGAPGSSYDMDVPSTAVRRTSSIGDDSAPDAMMSCKELEAEKELEKALLLTEVLEPPFTLFALEPGRLLDGRIEAMSEAMARTSWASIFYTSTPLTAGLSKPVFQVMVALIGVWFVLMASVNSLPQEGQPSIVQPLCKASAFRFVPLELRDGTRDITVPGIHTFGLTLDGVPLEDYVMEKAVYWVEGKEARAFFNYSIVFNGWYLVTSRDDPSKDPVSFEILALDPVNTDHDQQTIQDVEYDKYDQEQFKKRRQDAAAVGTVEG
eukprot:CAMPEP_0173412274 /NCGR_PEP_ID=MMETSP1356-20130122/79070_1 /TAXON_ID=77927 ORGANISM="Hemiselmis virescens, Strain PCC157" /NCGR_SAMPLE_ID=MMETSP1356 /ASSEMBLY_ACC=CAM_ASM_000847 /LENGTH=318 /DNA_ID=CAMNT_0014374151 /DNA_START=85 /DNA_END=1037 /DNA_ORIENTATION=+